MGDKIIRHMRELKNIGALTNWVIWGAGNWGRRLLQQARVLQFDLHIYDSSEEKVSCFTERITLKEIKGKIAEITFVIAVSNQTLIREIKGQIEELGGNVENVYRFLPEDAHYINKKLEKTGFYNGKKNQKALPDRQARELMENKIREGKPFMFSRWGSVEGNAVYAEKAQIYIDNDFFCLKNNAGFFPVNEETVHCFSDISAASAKEIDILCAGSWCLNVEELYRIYSPDAVLVTSAMMYPFWKEISWTNVLKGKHVLIVHPFAKLIERQYVNRRHLFATPDILPEFHLKVYPAVQSMGGMCEFETWFMALDKMKKDIAKIDFDIALLGCGAYGMPLGAFIKRDLQKQAVHMGGVLQCLFGIKGRRWEREGYDYPGRLYNEYWIRPDEELKPQNYKEVEGGCYW